MSRDFSIDSFMLLKIIIPNILRETALDIHGKWNRPQHNQRGDPTFSRCRIGVGVAWCPKLARTKYDTHRKDF